MPFRVFSTASRPRLPTARDVDEEARGTLDQQRLYQLIRQTGPITEHLFEIEFQESGAEVYCFTFG